MSVLSSFLMIFSQVGGAPHKTMNQLIASSASFSLSSIHTHTRRHAHAERQTESEIDTLGR